MRVLERTKRLACLLTVVSGLSGCSEEKASLVWPRPDGGTTSTPDGGSAATASKADAGGMPKGDGGASMASSAGDEVTISEGKVRGIKDGATQSFLGLPYAKPPLGELRWKAPVAPDSWEDTRMADTFGKRCAQNENRTLQNAASTDEDCLYLNVWTPDLTPDEPLPVMFWIHGGGNINGSASEPVPFAGTPGFYNARALAEKGVVVVTINYRLGVFGFFSHPALREEEGGVAGNQGLLDQTAALEWVKTNIEKFGGDPGKVTIFGESAGSLDVCLHVASPKSRDLFGAAISQSGGCTTKQPDVAEGDERTEKLAEALDCTGDDPLACLREKSAADLVGYLDPAAAAGEARPSFGPIVDGEGGFMPEQPRALFDAGEIAKVPYILGSNADEGTLFVRPTLALETEEDLVAALETTLETDNTAPILDLYPAEDFDNTKQRFARIVGDALMVCSTYDTAVRAAEAGAPVYTYNFNIPVVLPEALEAMLPVPLGASHGAELAYVFGTGPTIAGEAPAKNTSDTIQSYWTNLAKSGDPNGDGLTEWEKFTGPGEGDKRLNIETENFSVVDGFRAAECEAFRQGYEASFAAD